MDRITNNGFLAIISHKICSNFSKKSPNLSGNWLADLYNENI